MNLDFTGKTIMQYKVRQKLKERLSSSLYLAEDRKSKQLFFLEVLHVTVDEDEDLAGRFQRRMSTTSQIEHPLIAPVLYTGQTDEKRPYAVIQHCNGEFFDSQIAQWQETQTWPHPAEALHFIQHLAEALSVAHPAGLIHHDLRPANIFVQADSTPLLLDLGIPATPMPVKIAIEPGQTIYLDYAPPEQQQGKPLTGPSNIYSLGILLYQMLSGSLPPITISQWSVFEQHMLPKEAPLEELKPGLRPETYTLVKTCLWRQEWNRYETMQDMLMDIKKAILAEQTPPPHHIMSGISSIPRKSPYLLYGGIALLLIVSVIVAILLLNN